MDMLFTHRITTVVLGNKNDFYIIMLEVKVFITNVLKGCSNIFLFLDLRVKKQLINF